MIKITITIATIALCTVLAKAAQVSFNCNSIPETCNNMCFASSSGNYLQMHYDSNTANKAGRRTAAGCPRPNRCNTNPPTPVRTTCDEYPFASAHGTGTGGWFAATGASTRCVSQPECNSQGGTLSSFYQSFGQVDQTPMDIFVENFSATVAPYCNTAGMASDGQFATGTQPPNKRSSRILDRLGFSTGVKPPNKRAEAFGHVYRTASNRTIRSLSGPAEIGSTIFIPHDNWQSNEKVAAMLSKRQDDQANDDCTGTTSQVAAAAMLSTDELGVHDTIVEKL